MRSSRLTIGFAGAFLALAAIWAAALEPGGGGYRLLQPEEAAMVRGGSAVAQAASSASNAVVSALCPGPAVPAIGAGTPTGTGTGKAVNIILANVPYVTQIVNNSTDSRGAYYCGLASALMVRAKNKLSDSTAPVLYYDWSGVNAGNADNALVDMDWYLRYGYYGSGTGSTAVDVAANRTGLLYTSSTATKEEQYLATVNILKGVYTGKFKDGRTDNLLNYGHVSGVIMGPASTGKYIITITEMSVATKEIWNHIKANYQPVVVVVDSNKQVYSSQDGKVQSTSGPPTLHYIVIRGIRENGSGGTRYFLVYDPWLYSRNLEYTEENLLKLMALPSNTKPKWVYDYGTENVTPKWDIPAYILKVQGD